MTNPLRREIAFQPARAERGLDFDFGLMIGLQDNLFSTGSSCSRLHEAISGPFLSRRCAARLERTSGCEVVDRRAGLAMASFAVAHAIKDQLKFADGEYTLLPAAKFPTQRGDGCLRKGEPRL